MGNQKMDENKRFVIEKRIAKTMANLEKNNMQPFYAKTKEDALKIVESLIPTGQVVACGGSVTLAECGIMDLLRSHVCNSALGFDTQKAAGFKWCHLQTILRDGMHFAVRAAE